jgi:hypothetical protein
MARAKTLNLKNVESNIERGIETADAERAKALEHLQLVRSAKTKSLNREHDRLSAKYGDKHPRVVALKARIKLNDGLLNNLSTEIDRAKTEIPVVADTSWVLHGFVRDLNGKPLNGLTVAPYDRADRTGNWVKPLGFACTNERGYFKIEAKDIKESQAQVFLRVLNKDGATMFCDAQSNTPRPGGLDYREIRISGDVVECAPPQPPDKMPVVAQWRVTGTVNDATGAVVPKAVVRISDKEGKLADRFGKKPTNAKGEFDFTFDAEKFTDVVASKVDLFVQVVNADDRVLAQSTALKFEPGKTDTVQIAMRK